MYVKAGMNRKSVGIIKKILIFRLEKVKKEGKCYGKRDYSYR